MSKIILIGCGKAKLDHAAPAEELYTGSLFRARMKYARITECPWHIVSAMHGLVQPDQWLEPYDLKMGDLPFIDQCAWRLQTVSMLLDGFPDDTSARDLRDTQVELHMGADYAETLGDVLLAAGLGFSWPVKGLGIGAQLAWYKNKKEWQVKRR